MESKKSNASKNRYCLNMYFLKCKKSISGSSFLSLFNLNIINELNHSIYRCKL